MKILKLTEICDVKRGSSPRPKGDPKYFGGNVPRLTIRDVTRDGKYVTPKIDFLTEEGAKYGRFSPKGTLTMSISGTIGSVSFLNVDASVHDGFVLFDNIKKIIDIDYLYYFLKNYNYNDLILDGGIFKNLTTEIIKDIEIKIPEISIQKKIINKFLNEEKKIIKLKKLLEKIEIRNNHYADKLLSGELSIDEDGQLLKSNNLYDYKNLGELCDIKTGRKDANAGSEEGLYSFFTCSQETKKINEYSFDCEAILIAGNGIPGVCKYINGKFDAYQRVYVLNNFKENVSYIYKYMNSKFKKQIDNETQGAVIQYIKIDNIKDFKIAIPDEKTQNNIIKFLDNLENEKSKVEKLLELEEKRFEWLSDKLLSGEYIIEQ